ncbi:hypothetical protein [Prochlorothrix hollandica]|uniref:Uncharacterized protein n=1 Tax=Prochlorothrix hollandica PCC 9006 = CALU 1027 TaxID=317619 RepID=A0A0M2PR04_PROHO|nr:hypothetical protein [Prochlorothrix hollandica]KKI98965.1 hypothetical protein PROH_14160 [Prochlorothrix hollandica PCC 9006 = CALU 1027]
MLIQDRSAQKRKLLLSLATKRAKPGSGTALAFLQQRTWSFPVSSLQLILHSAPFVVIGGVATRLYMPERMTLDLDILVKTSDRALIYQDLEKANGKKISDLSIAGSRWQLADETLLKVLEADDDWVEIALAQPNYSPDRLPIIALPYLVLMKLSAGRTQDLADISRMLGLATEPDLGAVKAVISRYLPTAQEDLDSLIMLGKLEMLES